MTREEAARIIKKCKDKGFKYTFYTLTEYHTALDVAIQALEQQQKTGKWLHFAQSDECSVCGYNTGKYESPSRYCPNCGCRMMQEE